MRYILALDQGTTSCRAILFDESGRPRHSAQKEFSQIYPRPGWVEHDPMEIWRTQLGVARAVLRKARVKAGQVAAIGITNQRETTVVWDRQTGKPIANAIVWQDRRTADACAKLRKAGRDRSIQKKTGLVLDAYFSATKLEWLLRHVRGAAARARRGQLAFGTIDSWLVWNLTRGQRHVTDPSNASRTLLFNLRSGDWDPSLLKEFSVPASVLPEIVNSSGVIGETTLLGGRIPIAGIAGDQQAALFGQCCHRPGIVKNTYGTGCFLCAHTGDEIVQSRNKLLSSVAWRINGRTEYMIEGSVFIAGAVVQWLRDELGIIKRASDIEALASEVKDTAGVHLVPAFAGLGAPHWDPDARGTITGLTRGANRAHIARAALEGIAFQVAEVVQAMRADSGRRIRELRVDGGACANNLLMQFQADILGTPVVRSRVSETTALGAAYLAGLAVGLWPSKQELAKHWQADRRFSPAMKPAERKARLSGWHEALRRTRSFD